MPYTYLIGWSTQNQYYYGCRYAKNSDPGDLWVTYFTSSKYVKRLRESLGEPDIIEVRRTFTDREECVRYESRVLRRIVGRANFINKNVAGAIVGGNPSPRTDKQKASARACMTALAGGVWWTNGTDMKRLPADVVLPAEWYRGYPDWYKQNQSKILSERYDTRPGQFKDMKWYNDGHSRARYSDGNVPDGWVVGWKIKQPK